MLKKWGRELENRTDPMVKEIEQLHGFISTDMSRGISYLNEIIKSLQAYSELGGGLSSAPTAPPAETPAPDVSTSRDV